HVGSRADGRLVAVQADLGTRVQRGQALALLESVEVGKIRAEEREAEALLQIAQENHAREQRLAEQGISSRKELLEAEAQLRRAEAALHSAEDRLEVLGASHDHGAGGEFSLVAPFAGVVVARDASLGEMATPADTLFTVADLSEVWIELDIFERDLARVRRGQSVAVMVTAYPSDTFPGRIVYVGDLLDPAKRTVRARVEIPNAGGTLKPGMFATASIQVGGGGPPLAVVPQDAVQTVEGRRVVFVPGDAPGEFRVVPVELGQTIDGDRIVILSGIAPGDRVVTAGAFALRSELSKGEIGEGGH
ncbi:MAG: efflux RND transporter periplasmic adaptor subunit, partial [Gemmatimonadales bacterium]|nr:efflux RND transporter periplasmic adaptor subunit [Gemmatimonadales bacterium]